MNNSASVASRVCFCAQCAEKKPQKGDRFLLYHSDSKDYIVHRIKSIPVNGFTPHLFEYLGLDEEMRVKVRKICGIDGCGVSLKWNTKIERYDIFWNHESIIEYPIQRYNALRQFTNTGYEIKELC